MYLKGGRRWVSLVPSLLNAAAKATPAVGSASSHSPPFFRENNSLTAASLSNDTWQPEGTSSAGAARLPYDTYHLPLLPFDAEDGSAFSPDAILGDLPDLSFLDSSDLQRNALPDSAGSGSSSHINPGTTEATSGGHSSTASLGKASGFPVSSSFVSPWTKESYALCGNNSQSYDDICSTIGDSIPYTYTTGTVGEIGEGTSRTGNSPDVFVFPPPFFNEDFLQHPPPSLTLTGASFWDYSAWERVNARHNEVILLTDVDDTLWSSGGWRVADCTIGGVDKEYCRGDAYPGITALYFVLAAGRHVTAAARPPAQPSNVLLPFCPEPGSGLPLLELCHAASPTRPRGTSPPTFPDFPPGYTGGESSFEATSAAGETDVQSGGGLFMLSPSPESGTPQQPAAAPAALSTTTSLLHQGTLSSPPSPATFCGASSFSPATGIRRPNPAKCRTPLTLPPAVGLLTARLSTTFFKGWTRSPTFYHDIDWQLEHGARMMYGPNVSAGAWTHGFENNVELVRDTIGGQHSRGRAKVQGFRSALRAGLRPAAQVAAASAAARLRMASENGAGEGISGGRQQHFASTASAPALLSASGALTRHRGGVVSSKTTSNIGHKLVRHSVGGLPYSERTPTADGAVTTGEQKVRKAFPDLGPRAAVVSISLVDRSVGSKDNSARVGSGTGNSPDRKNAEIPPIAEFAQAIHFSRPSIGNRAVPVIFGDTGEKDLEVAASVAALASDRLAAVFSHFVFADRNFERRRASLRPELVVPQSSVPFTFK